MAWYLNHYQCGDCGTDWDDEWSCCCDDECPNCGSRNWSPYESEDLTEVMGEADGSYVIYRSPENADDRPKYEAVARFPSADSAMRYLNDGELLAPP